ncbi:MAG: mycofactocin-coupled SDR family oxidoreductase [Acidimicrobiales bacterium]
MSQTSEPSGPSDQPITAPVALVTGAARGIGAAVALCLARQGWQLVLLDACADEPVLAYRLARPDQLDAVASQCRKSGAPGVISVIADVRDQSGLDGAVARARLELGGLDAAVAVAGGIGGGAPSWETSDELWDVMLGLNLTGVWRLVRAAVPELLRRPQPRRGRIVAVASAGALVGLPRLSAYVAAKHAVVGLVRSLAAELGPEAITANVVAPGSTRTDMLAASAAVYGLADPEEFIAHHLDPRLLEPEEIAEAVAWLCSPASSGVTGAVLPVDAGMTSR